MLDEPPDDPSSHQSASVSQCQFETVKLMCLSCDEPAEAMEEIGSTIVLRPCGHTFRRSDLTAVIECLSALNGLIQRHDAATTPFERQGIREEIHTVAAELDAAAERYTEQMNLKR